MRARFLRLGAVALAVVLFAVAGLPYLIPLPAQPDLPPEALAPPAAQFITVAGVRTVMESQGPAGGPPVILVHGFGGSTFSWRHTLPALAEAGYRAIAVDLKGFGLSDKSFEQDYTHAAQAAFIAGLMDELQIERAVLVGHSMGGNVIAHFALRYPDRVDKLVFVDAAIVTEPGGLSLGPLTALPPIRRWGQIALRATLSEAAVTERLHTAYADPAFVTPEVAEGYLNPQRVKDWDLALLGIVRDSSGNFLPQPLSEITPPVLIVWGEADTWVPVERGEALRAQLPGAEWVLTPGAGHLPMEEQAQSFNKSLIAFLDR